MNPSLEAQIRDPLWLLGRQWQIAEFKGSDAGSAVSARLRAENSAISRYRPGFPSVGTTGATYAADRLPLESVVEGEPVFSAARGVRLSAQAGLDWIRLLQMGTARGLFSGSLDAYRGSFTAAYPIDGLTSQQRETMDGASIRFIDYVAGRVPDGSKLLPVLQTAISSSTLPPSLQVSLADVSAMVGLATTWVGWYDDIFNPPGTQGSAWVPERLEYQFAVGARTSAGEVGLVATEYDGGHLDWYSFDGTTANGLGAAGDLAPEALVRTVIPSPVTYRGMPARRWWQFEDAQVDLGAVDVGPEDLGRILMLEFAHVFGNDWFHVPVDLPVGSYCVVGSLVVSDTFGERFLIQPYRQALGSADPWTMFGLTAWPGLPSSGPIPGGLLVPPAIGTVQEGEPIEEVHFLRDEGADLGWAVERIVESPAGFPLDRYEAYQEARMRSEQASSPAAPASTGSQHLAFRLVTSEPDYWYPLIPVPNGTTLGRAIALQLGTLAGGDLAARSPEGTLLAAYVPKPPSPTVLLQDEEVPRSGVKVTRLYRRVRWTGWNGAATGTVGVPLIWVGHRVRPGRGEGSSGLRFDFIEST